MSLDPPQQQTPSGGGMPTIPGGARMPIPGNAEFFLWAFVSIVLVIIWAASDLFDAHGFAWAWTVLTAAYFLSRGIAKASRVLEQ
jgi:hypothetical protein